MELEQAIKTMRSVRQYRDAPVDDRTITQILEAGRWAGSAKNTQPWQFVLVKRRATLAELATFGSYSSHLADAAFAVLVVTPAQARAEFDAGRAIQNMLLAAWNAGVGSCVVSLDDTRARALLGIPADYRVQQSVAFGYPEPGVVPTVEGKPLREVLAGLGRRPLSEIVHHEHWGGAAAAIAIVPYDPAWPAEFERLAAPLRNALAPLALRVDHIGSTAVPGLAAKDVIDIQITVADFSPELEAALAALGYSRRADITGDHRPPGATGPDDDWRKWYFRTPADLRRHHLHVRRAGRPNQRYPLLFRDYLRAHPAAAGAYALIKQQLSRHHPADVDAYYDVKDPVCDIVWDAAQDWARATGWEPGGN